MVRSYRLLTTDYELRTIINWPAFPVAMYDLASDAWTNYPWSIWRRCMTKRTASMIVACLLTISIICQQTASAGSSPDKDGRFAQKVKSAF